MALQLTRWFSALLGLVRCWAIILYWVIAALLVAWIAHEASTTRLITYSQGTDYWEHSAALRELLESPFAPGNPHLRSEASSPRYNPVYLAIALVGRSLSLDVLGLMTLASAFNLALYVSCGFWFFASYFRDRRAPLYGLLVLLTSWWRSWHFSNVYHLEILPSVAAYPSTTALGLTWACFALVALVVRSGATPWRLFGVGALSALVFVVHPLTAVLALSGMGLLALLEPGQGRRTRAAALGAMALGLMSAHFWPYYSAFEVLSGGQHEATAGWAAKAAAQALGEKPPHRPNMDFYELQNLRDAVGLAAPGLLFALVLLATRTHLFIPLGLLSMLVPFGVNLFVRIPLGHRFVLLAMVYLHLAFVWGCLWLTPGYHQAARLLRARWARVLGALTVATVLGLGVWHNVPRAQARVARAEKLRLSPILNYARQVGRYAGRDAVVMGGTRETWSVPTFGPKVVALYHTNPLVADSTERARDVKTFLRRSTPDDERDRILRKYSVTHVLVDGRDARALKRYLDARGKSRRLAAGHRLYTLTQK